ncbi:hypothetical protein QV13_04305 [Mesorhizobium hungaricum]|jgi:two-component system, chemotaxis family, chemotaxis protein CheY|uniref:Response regulatory domain-containing protein n=1 Tax=Mesorhizobium hungaricum TaxID=1566387 RepID=A0A1C2E8Y3_9HYPH|nr:response regulator [Mesorhizobium sp.]OCX23429.1 hypothetical protein QV13_04305 [Mesorhizobium hungaricum]
MKRCMFVDKSSVIRKVARRILSGEGMFVAEAATGAAAIDLCATEMPDIIVVDSSLPDMQLTEFIGHIRSFGTAAMPLIIVLLVELDLGAIMRAKRAGAHGYLLKPFNRVQLLDRFRAMQTQGASPAQQKTRRAPGLSMTDYEKGQALSRMSSGSRST